MMLTPCAPSAGPTGGAGLAAPAWIWSLISPETFFLGGISSGPSGWEVTDVGATTSAAQPGGQIFWTWLKLSSTGVSRPKIETRTLSFWASGLISEIEAGSVANAPSMTVTDSPISKSTVLRSGAADADFSSSTTGARILTTS